MPNWNPLAVNFRNDLFLLLICSLATLSSNTAAAPTPECTTAYQEKIYAQVLEHCHVAADKQDAEAAFRMGESYEYITTEQRSGERAAHWYLIAANQGHPLAQRNLAALYDSGFGVVKDRWKAFQWYHKAALQGQPHSQLMTGMMYLDGSGTLKDTAKGTEWIRQAADGGEPNAQYMYGKLLYDQDPANAIEWYQRSAQQDNSYAQYRLGLLYYRGEHLEHDLNKALRFAEMALAADHPRAPVLKRKILEVAANTNTPLTALPAPTLNSKAITDNRADKAHQTKPVATIRAPSATATHAKHQPPTNTRAQSVRTPLVTAPSTPVVSSASVRPSAINNWLIQQPGSHYSIQLALMSKFSSIERFYRRYGLQEQSHHYRSLFNAGPMYVLLYGSYPSLEAAQAAIKTLPPSVQKMKPWIRPISRLQDSYRPVE